MIIYAFEYVIISISFNTPRIAVVLPRPYSEMLITMVRKTEKEEEKGKVAAEKLKWEEMRDAAEFELNELRDLFKHAQNRAETAQNHSDNLMDNYVGYILEEDTIDPWPEMTNATRYASVMTNTASEIQKAHSLFAHEY
jgi:hypothetical protein